MQIVLCECDAYPEPHDHARGMYLHPDGTWHTFIKRPDGSEANVGDAVRLVSWHREAAALAEALADIARRNSDDTAGWIADQALARWRKAIREDNRAVSGASLLRGSG